MRPVGAGTTSEYLYWSKMSLSALLPTLFMVTSLALIVVGLLIYLRTSHMIQREREEQRRQQARLTVEKQEALGRSAALKHGMQATSQAAHRAVRQLTLPEQSKKVALELIALLPKLPVPVDASLPYRQALTSFQLEIDRIGDIISRLDNPEVTRLWASGSYQDLCSIPQALLPIGVIENDADAVNLAQLTGKLQQVEVDKSGLEMPVRRDGWDD